MYYLVGVASGGIAGATLTRTDEREAERGVEAQGVPCRSAPHEARADYNNVKYVIWGHGGAHLEPLQYNRRTCVDRSAAVETKKILNQKPRDLPPARVLPLNQIGRAHV